MSIRNILIVTGSVLALAALATGAQAAGSVNATANASVTVASPITLIKGFDMNFGTVVRPSDASTSTVTLDTANTVTATNGGSVVGGTGAKSATFTLTGPSTSYTTTQSLSFTDPALGSPTASAPVATGTLGTLVAGTPQTLTFGGSFTMTAATPATAYTGTLSVTVNYP